jgi:hypothetical protein
MYGQVRLAPQRSILGGTIRAAHFASRPATVLCLQIALAVALQLPLEYDAADASATLREAFGRLLISAIESGVSANSHGWHYECANALLKAPSLTDLSAQSFWIG